MSWLSLSSSFEYLYYGSTAIINIFTPTARGSSYSDVAVKVKYALLNGPALAWPAIFFWADASFIEYITCGTVGRARPIISVVSWNCEWRRATQLTHITVHMIHWCWANAESTSLFSICNHHKCPLHLNTCVMGLRPSEIFYPFSAGIDFIRQNLASTDVRFWRLKSIPAL